MGIEERREYIRVDCTDGGAREASRLYQDFAVACVERRLVRALVKAGGTDPQDQLSLRDAFTAMVLAGIAPGFRIALVAPAGPIAAAFRKLQRDLRQLRIDAAVFRREDEAREWLLLRRFPDVEREASAPPVQAES
jgi:hypothetical protein